mmetsp:Transcript_60584/g.126841  ORF Transcript_60584/g.126841 Transcript_60584/m.126841 type:complete len:133 (+) Transcript_60584:57-455(+)
MKRTCPSTTLLSKTSCQKHGNPFDPIVDPSDECIGTVLLFIDWYLLFRRRYPPKDEIDIQDLQVLGLGFLDKCRTVFPFKNSQDCYYMATEKVHSIVHSPNDVARFCHLQKRDIKYGWDSRVIKQTRVLRFN